MDRRWEDHSWSLHREDREPGHGQLHIRSGPRFRTLDPRYGRQTNPPKVAGPFARASIWAELSFNRRQQTVEFGSLFFRARSSLFFAIAELTSFRIPYCVTVRGVRFRETQAWRR